MLGDLFKKRYLKSLEDFALFYDDFHEYGDRDAPTAFYFVPGIDGVAGQVRFALPSLRRVFGDRIYLRCSYLDEFSAARPIWEKFTLANIDKKRAQIVADLEALAHRRATLYVMVSSNGFYDLLYAYPKLSPAVTDKLKLIWVAVAPDEFRPTPWESIFYRLNGFDHGGHRWFAVPNHNAFAWINPETSTSHTWRQNGQARVFYKNDLESRLSFMGLQWSFNSLDCFNECLRHEIAGSTYPLPIPAYVLVATNDGYWQGRPLADIDLLLDKYLEQKMVLYKDASHLWVLTPDNVCAVLEAAKHSKREPIALRQRA